MFKVLNYLKVIFFVAVINYQTIIQFYQKFKNFKSFSRILSNLCLVSSQFECVSIEFILFTLYSLCQMVSEKVICNPILYGK